MKKFVLLIAAVMFSLVAAKAQVGLGLGYNLGAEGQGFSILFEMMQGYNEFGFEGDFLLKDRFEVTAHAGPRFPVGNRITISPCGEIGYRSPKSAIFGGSIVGIYNPYKSCCLYLKVFYGAPLDVQDKKVTVGPGGFKATFGIMFLI